MSTISTTINNGITLGATYTSPLTITATGAVNNNGTGTAIYGYAGTILNAGTIRATGAVQDGVVLGGAFGSDSIDNSSLIIATNSALYLAGNSTVTNTGTVSSSGYDAIDIGGTGTVTNSTGTIASAHWGIRIRGAGSVSNGGTIQASNAGVVVLGGGTVTNTGHINAPNGIEISGGVGSVVNAGSIDANGSDGVTLSAGGTVTNQANAVISSVGYTGVAITGGAGELVNAGTISAAQGVGFAGTAGYTLIDSGAIAGTAGTAVLFGAGNDLLQFTPSASVAIQGTVDGGGGTNTLEFTSGATTGTLTGNNASFTNFAVGTVDAGAQWVLAGNVTFGSGITLANNSALILAASGTLVNDGFMTAELTSNSILGGGTAALLDNLGGIQAYNIGVSLRSGGTVINGASGNTTALISANYGVYAASGLIGNYGTISASGTGSESVLLGGTGQVSNHVGGLITGHNIGVDLSNGTATLTNFGVVSAANNGVLALYNGDVLMNGPGALIAGTRAVVMAAFVTTPISDTLQNYGTITGQYGVIAGVIPTTGTLHATIVDAGTIIGTGGTAVAALATSASASVDLTLRLLVGNDFIQGAVVGEANGTGVLDFVSGSGTGTLTGSGADFVNFQTASVDAGANWTFAGTNTLGANTTLVDAGTLTNTGSLVVDPPITVTGIFINSSIVSAPGTYTAFSIASGGVLTNTTTGTISAGGDGAYANAGTGTVVNQGSISASNAGVFFIGAGAISNASGGVITGGSIGVGDGAGTVVNQGSIGGGGTGGIGVAISSAGTGVVSNASGGVITGPNFGVSITGAGVVSNASGAAITATNAGVVINGTGTVVNQGTIIGLVTDGIGLEPGVVTNAAGARITGGEVGVAFQGLGTLFNDGTISSSGAGSPNTGVFLFDGGTVTNGASSTSALITGSGAGVAITTAAGMVTNAGTITGTSPTGFGVGLAAGGTVVDSGLISGGADAVQFGGTGSNLLVLQHGYALSGAIYGSASASNTLELLGTGAANAVTATYNTLGLTNFSTIAFAPTAANYATLKITNDATLPHTITNFTGLHDTIDLTTLAFVSGSSTATFNTASDELTVSNGTNSVTLQLGAGTYSTDFGVVSDGTAGTDITVNSLTYAWIGPSADWRTATNWRSGIIPGTTASATIANAGSNTVTISSAESIQVANLTLTNSNTLDVAGTLSPTGAIRISSAVLSVSASGLITHGGSGTLISGTGVVNNNGTIAGGNRYGIVLTGTVLNQGSIGATVNATTIVNLGTISNTTSFSTGAVGTNGAFAEVINGTSGATNALIDGANTGVRLMGGSSGGTVVNYGTVIGTSFLGVDLFSSGGTVGLSNYGTILGGGSSLAYAAVHVASAATIKNTGVIEETAAGSAGVYVRSNPGVTNIGLNLNNSGLITAVSHAVQANSTIPVVVTNSGTLIGSEAFAVFSTLATSQTLIDSGTVIGTSGIAVAFGAGNDLLQFEPSGSAFVQGIVDGAGGTNTLEFASSSGIGTLTGSNADFVNFGNGTVDAGARWVLAGNETIGATTTLNIAGTLTDSGTLMNIGTVNGISDLFLSNGAFTNAVGGYVNIAGIYAASASSLNSVANFATISATSGYAIYFAGSGNVSNAAGALIHAPTGIRLNGTNATVANLGSIDAYQTGPHSYAVYLRHGGLVTNGASGNATSEIQGYYAVGVKGGAGTVINDGTIIGTDPVSPTIGGGAVMLNGGGYLANGVSGASGAFISGASDGVVIAVNGSINNRGSIVATRNGVIFTGSGTLVNYGGITAVQFAGAIVEGTAAITNFGTIAGISAGAGGLSGTIDNAAGAVITAGTFGAFMYGDSTVTNAGTISATGSAGVGVYFLSGNDTLFESGSISGGTRAVAFAGTGTNLLVLEHGFALQGAVLGSASATNTVELLGTSNAASVSVNYNGLRLTNFGTVAFAAGASNYADLTITNNATLPGTIVHFTGSHDTIDLTALNDAGNNAFTSFNTATHQLTVTAGTASVALQLGAGNYDGITYVATNDGDNGTELRAASNTPPVITGAVANQGVPNGTPSTPFATVGIEDSNVGAIDTVAITFNPSGGTLGNLSGGVVNNGTYTVSGTPAAVSAAVEALTFTPAAPSVGFVATQSFTISATGPGGTVSDSTTNVTSVQQVLGLATVPSSQLNITVTPNGTGSFNPRNGFTNESVIRAPAANGSYVVPEGYQAAFLGGTVNAELTDTATGNALLVGNPGNDTLSATAANDTILGGAGSNLMFGGNGALLLSNGASDTIGALSGGASVQASGNAPLIFGDFTASAGSLSVSVGGAAATVSAGNSAAAITTGGNGALVYGGFGAQAGALSLVDTGRGDTVSAGDSSASLTLSGTNALVFGGFGAGAGSLNVTDGGSGDTISAGNSAATITGGAGPLLVFGGAGTLNVVGGSGGVTVVAGTGATSVAGGAGSSTLYGSAGSAFTFTGGNAALYVAANGNESLNASGSSGGNELVAGADSTAGNLIVGGSGNDTLYAGAGADTLAGGSGNNLFAFFSSLTRGNADVVSDFNANDTMYLSGYGANDAATALAGATSSGGNTTITLSDNTRITFLGVGAAGALQGHMLSF